MEKKNWWLILGTTAALAAATVLVMVLKRSHLDEHLNNVPELITDCYDRIHELEVVLLAVRLPKDRAQLPIISIMFGTVVRAGAATSDNGMGAVGYVARFSDTPTPRRRTGCPDRLYRASGSR